MGVEVFSGPLVVALVAGGLSTVNPCGFAMLPAFLAFYAGADEDQLPNAPSRLAQGLIAGVLVAAGFLAVFAAVALPFVYGAREIVRSIPWAGIGLGIAMIAAGIATVAGWHPRVPWFNPVRPGAERRPRSMVIFGFGYGVASLGCTLPVFLAVVGASLASDGPVAGLGVLGAYAGGMAAVLIVLAVAAGFLRSGVTRALRRLLPHMDRLGGGMLVIAGTYLSYYWGRIRFGSAATLSDDPVVGFVGRFTAAIERFSAGNGRMLMAGVLVGAIGTVAASVVQWRRSDRNGASQPSLTDGGAPAAPRRPTRRAKTTQRTHQIPETDR